MGEFLSAIEKMKSKGVAGLEKIPLSFHKSLGPLALQNLLSIFNSSFSLAHCPRIWRVAIIIPLLTDGKSSCEVASFYPNSLTFCVVKLFERILADRLDYISQARFRKGRSCKDQITQIVQAREDSFQQPPMQSSVLTLLDISKAYDTVWRKKLLLNMLDAGIPSTFIRWLSSFFNDHRARVQLFNVCGSRCRFNQDLVFYYFCY